MSPVTRSRTESYRWPLVPSSMCAAALPPLQARIGNPKARASCSAMPNVSISEGDSSSDAVR